jgi:hypothetical protein
LEKKIKTTTRQKKKKMSYDYVVGIDVGTSRSGWVFASTTDKKIICEPHGQTLQVKIPTCMLVKNNPPSYDFLAFGDDAKHAFERALMEEKEDTVLFIANYKMELYDVSTSTKYESVTIKAINNNHVCIPLAIVFQHTFAYFKSQIEMRLKSLNPKLCLDKRILFVLTCPTIWNQSAKEFMKTAATRAGMQHLLLSLESEAAALCCHQFNAHANPNAIAKQKRMQMVADLGGGTADFTIQEYHSHEHSIVEVCPSSGGVWGSSVINHYFVELLKRVLGSDIIHKLQFDAPHLYMDLCNSFEVLKALVDPDDTHHYYHLRLPPLLLDHIKQLYPTTYTNKKGILLPFLSNQVEKDPMEVKMETQKAEKSLQNLIRPDFFAEKTNNEEHLHLPGLLSPRIRIPSPSSPPLIPLTGTEKIIPPVIGIALEEEKPQEEKQKSDIWFWNGNLKIPKAEILACFVPSVDPIVKYIETQLTKYVPLGLSDLYVVGGFSQSKVLQSRLKSMMTQFTTRTQLIIPPHPGEAVLTGSVLFGLNPTQIKSRAATHTYVLKVACEWDEKLYAYKGSPYQRTTIVNNKQPKLFCNNRCLILCKKGDAVPSNQVGFEERVCPFSDNMKFLTLVVGCTDKLNPSTFSNYDRVETVGTLNVELDPSITDHKQQEVAIRFFLGDTELRISAINMATKKDYVTTFKALKEEIKDISKQA